jgi:hypothetical protein
MNIECIYILIIFETFKEHFSELSVNWYRYLLAYLLTELSPS